MAYCTIGMNRGQPKTILKFAVCPSGEKMISYEKRMKLERLIKDLKSRAGSRKKEFETVVSQLRKMKPEIAEELISETNETVFSTLDCLECGNCCRILGPRLLERDVKRLAESQRMKTGAFIKTYLKKDGDGDLVFKQMPCPFLGAENLCAVYAVRPKACEEYPHTSGRQVQSRLGLLVKNSEICPAVFLILEELKKSR